MMKTWPHVVNERGCWICTLGKTSAGYAIGWERGKPYLVHIRSYEQTHGPVSKGFDVDHQCNNPSCINPAHLKAMTHADNIRRGRSRLTWDQVREIRRRYRGGAVFQWELAAEFGITKDSVSDIITGRRWAE